MPRSLAETELLVMVAILHLREKALGPEIQREIARRFDRSIPLSSIYTALDRLEAEGYLVSRPGT